MLTKKALGKTGLSVSPIALGTVKIGRKTDIKYPKSFELPSDKEVVTLLNTAKDLGINLIDTAPAYGNSESRLGKLLPGARGDWIICTKAGEEYDGSQSIYNFTRSSIEQSVARSLERLNTDYLDIVLLHSDGNDQDILNHSDALPVLLEMKQQGIVRAVGISSKTVEGGLLAVSVCDVLMLTLNLDDRSQLPVIETAWAMERGVLLKKVFSSGRGDPETSIALALSQPGVHSAVLGTLNPQHLTQNTQIAEKIEPDY